MFIVDLVGPPTPVAELLKVYELDGSWMCCWGFLLNPCTGEEMLKVPELVEGSWLIT